MIGAMPFGTVPVFAAIGFSLGWTQLGGRCGTAHANTFGFLWKLHRRLWLRCLVNYCLAGLVASTLVGAALGLVGAGVQQVAPNVVPSVAFAVTLVLLIRELGLVRFRLPQKDVQTERAWAYEFGWPTAAGLWGFHIGIGFVTVITYGGYWALVAAVIASRSPMTGALIFASYWLGRVAPFWISPWYAGARIEANLSYAYFKPLNSVILIWAAIVLARLSIVG
jgi:uncharacterized membrane protein